jgi:exodeoxyribonuclease VII small subunit
MVIIDGKIPRMAEVPNNTAAPNFEAALKRLEEIVKKLEGGELPLDTALELFEEGIQLSRFCNTTLAAAERRVEILLKSDSGQPRAVPFETEHED